MWRGAGRDAANAATTCTVSSVELLSMTSSSHSPAGMSWRARPARVSRRKRDRLKVMTATVMRTLDVDDTQGSYFFDLITNELQ